MKTSRTIAEAAIYAVALCAGLSVGCVNPVPIPPDDVTPPAATIEAAAADGMATYQRRSAEVFEGLAAELRAGQFATQAAFADELERRTKAARLESFGAMRDAWQADNPETWSPEADAVKCIETARGFRRG